MCNLNVLITSCDRVPAFQELAARVKDQRVFVADNSTNKANQESIRQTCKAYGFTLTQLPFKPFQQARLRNLLIEQADESAVIIFLDSDIIPISDTFFEDIAAFHKLNPESLCVHARYKENDSTELRGNAIHDPYRTGLIEAGKRIWRISSGGNCSIRRNTLASIRYDEQFVGNWGWEDTDFTRQIYEACIPIIFQPHITAIHRDHPIKRDGREANRAKFQKKWAAISLAKLGKAPSYLSNKARRLFGDTLNAYTDDCYKLVEVGAGDGWLAHYLAAAYGVEVDMIEPYDNRGHRSDAEENNAALSARLRDATKLHRCLLQDFVSRERFHYAYAYNALHHIAPTVARFDTAPKELKTIVKSLRRLHSRLVKGARFFAIDVDPIGPKNIHYKNLGTVELATKHYPEEWQIALEQAGFKDISAFYFWPPNVPHDRERYGYQYRITAHA